MHKFKKIKLLAMDFDGVMTDGYVYVDQDGRESVRCSRKDGLGIEMLKKIGVEIVVLSKETNSVVAARCKKLNTEFEQSLYNGNSKLSLLKDIIQKRNLKVREVAYVGDDLNDLDILNFIGLPITVADSHPRVKESSVYITKAKGGEHAVREICEKILQAKNTPLLF